jgi:hypothetical protein
MRRKAEAKSARSKVARWKFGARSDHQVSGCVRQGDCDGRHAVLVETPPALAL